MAIVAVSIPMAATVTKAVNTVTLYKGSYSYSVGGEFTAVTSPNNLSYYSSSAERSVNVGGKTVTGFETFCIETGVAFSPGKQYTYTTPSKTAADNGAAGSGLALSVGAAFLYYEFGTGNLTGYNYSNTKISSSNPSRLSDAGLLQAAIWYFQGEQTYSGFDGSKGNPAITSDPFYLLAISTFGTLANAMVAYTGTAVEIMQLWNGSTPAQAQLVLTGTQPTWNTPPSRPVPDGGMTAALLGMGLAGMFMVKFWQRRTKSV